jgi:hypothetical protein
MADRAEAMRAIAPSMPPHVCPWQGRRRPTTNFYAAGEFIDFAIVAVCGLKKVLFAPAGPLKAHAEVLCRRRRRRNYGSYMRRRWRTRREAIGQRLELDEGTSPLLNKIDFDNLFKRKKP